MVKKGHPRLFGSWLAIVPVPYWWCGLCPRGLSPPWRRDDTLETLRCGNRLQTTSEDRSNNHLCLKPTMHQKKK